MTNLCTVHAVGAAMEMGGPGEAARCLVSAPPRYSWKSGAGGGCPQFPSSPPMEHRGIPQEGPDPRDWGLYQPFPTPLTCFFPTSALIQDKAGQLETQLQSGLGCGREGLPKGLGDRSPQPADLVQKRRVPGGGLRATSGGPACERLEVTVEWALELSGLRVS